MVLSKFFRKVFITESQQEFPHTIALVGGSYKPPTAAHWYMVEQYVTKADEVIILISDPKNPKSIRRTANGTVITAQMAKDIFDIYINRYNLQRKVKAIISSEPSPITALFKYIDDNLQDVNVIMGVSKKGGDEARFKSAEKYYADNEHIHLYNPLETAVEPYLDKNGQPISATDVRNNIGNIEIVKKYLPERLTSGDIQKILDILEVKPISEAEEASKNDLRSLDEEESIHLDITDDLLSHAKIMAYNVGLQTTDHKGKDIPVTPKKFPEKAVNIQFVANNTPITIFLDTETKKWDSNVDFNGVNVKLSPEQMGQFFCSNFYSMLMAKLQHEWPLTDELYGNLYSGIANKEMLVGLNLQVSEAGDNELSHDRSETHNASGRKYMNFSDVGVKGDSAKYTCWPKQGKEFKWSQWKDWKKIKPLCRMRFKYSNGHEYGISLSVIGKDYENRGFKSYDLTAKPILQWLTKEENTDLMKLSAVSKFVRFCANRIQKYVDMDPKDVYEKINNPDSITIEEIANTQSKIRKTLNNIIKKKQPDSFKWA